ncbi:MAG: hypothetical protein IK114_03840 [Fibrobacter sp.]|nr:hypothetical protein [Fibrobacter sp.]
MDVGIKDLIRLSVKVLKNDTPYIRSKSMLDGLFNDKNDLNDESQTFIRLTTLDALYSTNMSKRLYGLDDLANALSKIDYTELREESAKYKKNGIDENSLSYELFRKAYGCSKIDWTKIHLSKKVEEGAQAGSLISKYLYFATDYNFPIVDSLVRDNINSIMERFSLMSDFNCTKTDLIKNDFLLVKLLVNLQRKYDLSIEDDGSFSPFDNFLWLYGKIKKGSLSLILNKEEYKNVVDAFSISEGDIKIKEAEKGNANKNQSSLFDLIMAEKLKKELEVIKDVINDDLYEFIKNTVSYPI